MTPWRFFFWWLPWFTLLTWPRPTNPLIQASPWCPATKLSKSHPIHTMNMGTFTQPLTQSPVSPADHVPSPLWGPVLISVCCRWWQHVIKWTLVNFWIKDDCSFRRGFIRVHEAFKLFGNIKGYICIMQGGGNIYLLGRELHPDYSFPMHNNLIMKNGRPCSMVKQKIMIKWSEWKYLWEISGSVSNSAGFSQWLVLGWLMENPCHQ